MASKHHSNNQSWLIGVPKKSAGLWWRINFRPGAMGSHNVPEHIRSAGMYCPDCQKGQHFSDRCAFCGCGFSCYIVIEAERQPDGAVTPVATKQGICYVLPASLQSALVRLGKASLRVRVTAVCVMSLLLAALVVGIVQHRSHLRKQYAQNYVQALYLIRSGMNLDEMVSNGTFDAWRGVESSAVPETSEIGPQARADLGAVKANLDNIMEKMGTPSGEYSQAAQILQRLYALYEKSNSMVLNSPDSLSQHTTEIFAAKVEFSREIRILKVNLPVPLAEELEKASKKYDLRFMALEK